MCGNSNPVATSASGSANTLVAPATTLKVTVRRDFPLRAGEQLGLWGWSQPDGTRIQSPMDWPRPLAGPLQPGQERPLDPLIQRAIFGWGIGKPFPDPGTPGDPGGAKTTDDSRWGVIDARVELRDSGDVLVANAQTPANDVNGEVNLTTTGFTGRYTLKVVPVDIDNTDVGPNLATGAGVANFLYRGVDLTVTLSGGRLDSVVDPYDPPGGSTDARIGNRVAFDPTTQHLPLSLKPVWMNLDFNGQRTGGSSIQAVIIHRTSGFRLGNALNQFTSNTPTHSPRTVHYIIDVDGHTIKLQVDDREGAGVVSTDRWATIRNLNHNAIGIEIVNPNRTGAPYTTQSDPPYTPEQTRAAMDLCQRLVAAYPIEHRIVGHSDVGLGGGTTPNTRYGTKREWDPGRHFGWESFEARGLGIVPGTHFNVATSYGGVFQTFAPVVLRRDRGRDHDAGVTAAVARYGGVNRPGFNDNVIAQLQEDLREIGYTVNDPAGLFDRGTHGAVNRFKRHFFSGTRGQTTGGDVDQETAACIKNVAEARRTP